MLFIRSHHCHHNYSLSLIGILVVIGLSLYITKPLLFSSDPEGTSRNGLGSLLLFCCLEITSVIVWSYLKENSVDVGSENLISLFFGIHSSTASSIECH